MRQYSEDYDVDGESFVEGSLFVVSGGQHRGCAGSGRRAYEVKTNLPHKVVLLVATSSSLLPVLYK
jgi:hypothetical protein